MTAHRPPLRAVLVEHMRTLLQVGDQRRVGNIELFDDRLEHVQDVAIRDGAYIRLHLEVLRE